MKILLLPAYFPPEIISSNYLDDNRNEAFARAGFDMVFYVPMPTRGISKSLRKKYNKKSFETFYENRLTVHRFKMFREKKNPILRAFRYFLCSLLQLVKGISARDIDVIFIDSTPPTQGPMGAILRKIKKIPFIYNLQDIFPDSMVGTGLTTKNSFLWKVGRLFEDFTYNNADKIIVISEDFKKNIIQKGVPEEKIVVINNWVDENEVINIDRSENILFKKFNLDPNKFYLTYCGNIGLTQNMDLLLEVAKELESIKDINFILFGDGAYKNNVEKIINNNNIQNIHLFPFQPYQIISHVFSLGDVGLVISKPGVGENSVPSKTWNIMSAERAVLANFDENELKGIIEDNNCGIFTKAGDKGAFIEAIKLLFYDRERCRKMGENGRKYIIKNLTKDIGTSKYVKVIKDLVI